MRTSEAAADNGFRILHAGASATGPWLLALDRPEIAAEIAAIRSPNAGPGIAHFTFATLTPLYVALDRAYRLGVSLPDAPLVQFEAATQTLPRATESGHLVIQRIGQDIFRQALIAYWGGRCPLTGITDPALLRASHIIPWADCENDAERLEIHNGLLPSALWDAAFDRALVTFDDQGRPEFAPSLSEKARAALPWSVPIPLTDKHRYRIARHCEQARSEIGSVNGTDGQPSKTQ